MDRLRGDGWYVVTGQWLTRLDTDSVMTSEVLVLRSVWQPGIYMYIHFSDMQHDVYKGYHHLNLTECE